MQILKKKLCCVALASKINGRALMDWGGAMVLQQYVMRFAICNAICSGITAICNARLKSYFASGGGRIYSTCTLSGLSTPE